MRVRFRLSPYGRLCLGLGLLILIGWVVLMQPGMAAGVPLTKLDCLFTSTSAVCVTGLIVRRTGGDFTFLGQLVILIMIQIGGLGFMTLSSSVLVYLRRKATLREAALIRESWGSAGEVNLPRLLYRCLRIVVLVEGIGALLLFIRFAADVPEGMSWLGHLPRALWAAIFHSVSAFCNAGFSIWDTSMVRYVSDPWVNLVMMTLIVLGGLGFFVLADLDMLRRARRNRKEHRVKFQTHVVLMTTVSLLLGGAILIWIGERLNPESLAGHSLPGQWMAALFHSVTARTAGFNTVDMTQMSNFSLAVLSVLMFIGASPGSCGGGIKTTAFAVVVTLAAGSLRSGREPSIRNRSFGPVTVRSAIALFFVAAAIVLSGALFLMLLETAGTSMQDSRGGFVTLLFEATSAFGTVGLTTGITPHLTQPAKVCLIVLMFLGRIGPLGLISATLRGGARPEISYPHEDIQIG